MAFWGTSREHHKTIEPGQNASLTLFMWKKGTPGYYIVDAGGEAIARFQDRERKFVLTLRDRLGRMTTFRFRVEFDDTHLKNTPQLEIVQPGNFIGPPVPYGGKPHYPNCESTINAASCDFLITQPAQALSPGRTYRVEVSRWARDSIIGDYTVNAGALYFRP